ncbi:hypothetical protein PENTCL1PPCAC_21809, partial [Pristionchus entomophagus]
IFTGRIKKELDMETSTLQSRVREECSDDFGEIAEVVPSKDALRLRSRKCGVCSGQLTPSMKERTVISYTKRRNSKLYHLRCFKELFPNAVMDNPVKISPFAMKIC